MNCIVIEDNLVQEHLITSHINDTSSLNLLGSYTNCESAVKKLTNSNVDILFLDIETPNMNGIAFLEEYNLEEKTHVILTSAKSKYAIKAFDNGVTDYLLKPISYNRFTQAINKVVAQNKKIALKKEYMFIKSKGLFLKLLFRDIIWIQSACEYVQIYTLNKKYLVYSSMAAILNKLPNSFIRVHRSNIVSIDKIDKIDGNTLEVNGALVKVSKMYKDDLMVKLGIIGNKYI